MSRSRTLTAFALLILSCVVSDTGAPCPSPRTAETVAPGLEHVLLCRGEVAAATGYRVLVGVFDRQSDADMTLNRLHEDGIAAFPQSEGKEYWIVTRTFSSRDEAEAMKLRLGDGGLLPPLEIQEVDQNSTRSAGPWRIHVLVADPKRIDVRVAHAYDAAIGLETTANLAKRRGATAAINGGYYRTRGLLAGDSQGALQIDGRLLSEPDRGRGSVGFFDANGAVEAIFGRIGFRGEVHLADDKRIALDGLNRQRKATEVVIFTPDFHRTTLTPPDGAEVVIEDGLVAEVREKSGSSVIPADGVVLSISPERVEEVLPLMRRGAAVSVETEILSLLPDPEGEWQKAESILGAGPLLLSQGRRLEEPAKESISRVFFLARHPRTAVGVREDGTLLFVTVDGRQPGVSVGMSIPELTDLMLELGATDAVNLDGGGSTTMVVEGRVVNKPTDANGARHNADAILLFPRSQ